MNTKDLIREGTGGTLVEAPEAGRDRLTRRAARRGSRSPYSAFALKGVRRFERRATYEPFRIY